MCDETSVEGRRGPVAVGLFLYCTFPFPLTPLCILSFPLQPVVSDNLQYLSIMTSLPMLGSGIAAVTEQRFTRTQHAFWVYHSCQQVLSI